MNNLDVLKQYWPILVPLIVVQLALMLFALVHVLRHPRYRFGNKPMWIAIVVLFQFIGPIVYFVFGRSEE